MSVSEKLRSYWTFVVREKFGYHRQMDIATEDEKSDKMQRLAWLEDQIGFLDANIAVNRRSDGDPKCSR